MKKDKISFQALFITLLLLSGSALYAQKKCEVLMPEISGSYKGKCKEGLANGKGVAVGVDTYEGRFSEGLPDGKGKYTWADGRVYNGSWSEGVKEGQGTMTFPRVGGDSIVTGIWKDDEYLGPVPKPPYQVMRMLSVPRYTIRKVNEIGSVVTIGIFLSGSYNTDIDDFSLASDSGEQFTLGSRYGLQNAIVPYTVTLRYRSWNYLHTQQHDVIFEFRINEPGTFEVNIHN